MKKLTREVFMEYELMRRSGEYNMITDARFVMDILGIDEKMYFRIIRNYRELKEKYMKEEVK